MKRETLDASERVLLCIACGRYQPVRLMGSAELVAAHPGEDGATCDGSGEAWESVKGGLEDVVPVVDARRTGAR